MIGWIADTPRQYRFAPRVDGKSLVLRNVPGEKEEARISDIAVRNNEVLIWDATNYRIKSTGVSDVELQALNGVNVGLAAGSKALVLNSSKDISGIRNMSASRYDASGSITAIGVITAGSLISLGNSELRGDLELTGKVNGVLKLGGATGIQSLYNSTYRDVIRRSGTGLYMGNTSDELYMQTGSSANLVHRKGTTNYTIWDSSNGGAGSGMDADKLDGLQSTSFLRSDTSATLYGNLTLAASYLSFYDTNLVNNEMWRIRMGGSDSSRLEVYSIRSNKNVLTMYESGTVLINDNLVMHKGNDGHSSGFDADTVDNIHGSSFLRSDLSDTFRGTLSFGASTGTMLAFGSKSFIRKLDSVGAAAIGADNMMIIGSGEFPSSASNYYNGINGAAGTYIEDTYVGADSDVCIVSGADSWGNRKVFKFDKGGQVYFPKGLTFNGGDYDSVIAFNPPSDYDAFIYTYGFAGDDQFIFRVDTTKGTPNWGSGYFTMNGSLGKMFSQSGFVTRSDLRVKEGIREYKFRGNVLDKISSLVLKSFRYKNSSIAENLYEVGLIAQELEKVFPDFVSTEAVDKQLIAAGIPSDLKTIDYGKLSLIAIEGIKSLIVSYNKINERLYDLENKNK